MKLPIIFCNRYLSLMNCLVYLAFILLFSIWSLNQINNNWHLNLNFETWKNLKVFLITFCSIGLFFSILLVFTTLLVKKEQFLIFKNQLLLLSLISLNFFLIVVNSSTYFYQKNKKFNLQHSEKWWIRLGFHSLSIFDITLIGLFSALVVLGSWFETTINFLPYGAGGLNIKYLFVIVISFLGSVVSGFITGAVASLISLLFIGGNLIISPWSYLLDYFLPTVSPCIAGLFYSQEIGKNKKLDYLNYVLMIVFSYLLIWFWQTLSGYLIWTKIITPNWGSNGNGLLYSLVFNGLSIWVFSYPLTQALIPIIIRCLRPLPWKQ